ncbi:MAG: HAD family hydrolase [archaeon]
MKYDIVAFDLQGTLSDSAFSDEFWMETLPHLYSKYNKISLVEAKEELKKRFKEYGKYDYRYYSVDYWLKELKLTLSFKDLCKLIKHKPHFYEDSIKLIKELSKEIPLVIISSTTKEFIEIELGRNNKYFKKVFSSIDDFNMAGKPKELYTKIAQILNVEPNKIIYIGNDSEMDIKNAKEGGFKTFFFDNDHSREENINRLKTLIL